MRQASSCDDFNALLDCLASENDNLPEPLEEKEVVKIARSVWKYQIERRNWIGEGSKIVTNREDIDAFLRDSNAFLLWSDLRACHGWRQGGDFVLANATAARFGWTEDRFKKARNRLVEMGRLQLTWEGGNGPGDPPKFRLI